MKIYAPLTGPEMPDVHRDILRANDMHAVDGVEFRYDLVKNPNTEVVLTMSEKPVLFTNMCELEGGKFAKNFDDWKIILQQALAVTPRPVAISVGMDYYQRFGEEVYGREKFPEDVEIIWTAHKWDRMPDLDSLKRLYRAAKRCTPKPDVVKIAAKANSYQDALTMLQFVDWAYRKKKDRVIGLPMGPYGVWVRAVGCSFGNALTFAALSPEKVSGPGQPTVEGLEKCVAELSLE
jgi:3-dehydroquinate dehydratase type I